MTSGGNQTEPTPRPSSMLPEAVSSCLDDGATIVTATHRLAREYRQQYDVAQTLKGKTVWDTGDILPMGAWLNRCWQRIRVHCDDIPTLLNELQIHGMWEKIIADDISQHSSDSEPLWNVSATTGSALDAWQLLKNWDIDLKECEQSFQQDHTSFARWAKGFMTLCKEKKWIDPPSLIDEIILVLSTLALGGSSGKPDMFSRLMPERSVVLAGFDRITPQQQRLIDFLNQNQHPKVITLSSQGDIPTKTLDVRTYPDEYDEWLAAAHWAKGKLTDNPNQRLAIVVPDLNRCRDKLDHALSQVLCPNQLLLTDLGNPRPYHLSLGQSINAYPVIKTAIILLRLMVVRTLPYDVFASLLHSPFLAGSQRESFLRYRLERWGRQQLPFECTLGQFIDTLENADGSLQCPVLIDRLKGFEQLRPDSKPVQSLAFWEQRFKQGLEQMGWPGEVGLNSDEFQTVEAFFGHLKTVITIDLIGELVTARDGFQIIEKRLFDETFQPETGDTSLEVVGVLEATGIRFDAIWFGGLSEQNWPAPLKASPFIPRNQQEQAGFHQATIGLNSELARIMQNRLENDCVEIIFSRPLYDQDILIAPSPLFPEQTAEQQAAPPHAGSLVQQLHLSHAHARTHPFLEIVEDTPGLPVSHTKPKGGTSLIQDQSICPWRAYSRFRLGATMDDPNQQGLDALDRGSIIHGALELIWKTARSLSNLRQMDAQQRIDLIENSIQKASRRYAFISGCGSQFLTVQNNWLFRLLDEWLEIELTRSDDFNVVELEKNQTLSLAGLELCFKIDRIDQLQDGSLVLIDYKTGAPVSLGQWIGPRPEAPQLPLYAIAQMENIEAIAFAHINHRDLGFVGVSQGQDFQLKRDKNAIDPAQKSNPRPVRKTDKVKPLEQDFVLRKTELDWEGLLLRWYDDLTNLAEQFLQGDARIDPLNTLACDRCDLHSFCRIHEGTKIEISNPVKEDLAS